MVHQQTVADPGKGPGGPPFTFRPNWGPKGRKKFFGGDRAPRFLRVWINAPPPPQPPPSPYLKVWIRHCQRPENLGLWLT